MCEKGGRRGTYSRLCTARCARFLYCSCLAGLQIFNKDDGARPKTHSMLYKPPSMHQSRVLRCAGKLPCDATGCHVMPCDVRLRVASGKLGLGFESLVGCPVHCLRKASTESYS